MGRFFGTVCGLKNVITLSKNNITCENCNVDKIYPKKIGCEQCTNLYQIGGKNINFSYYSKYIKYKTKYIKLKNKF